MLLNWLCLGFVFLLSHAVESESVGDSCTEIAATSACRLSLCSGDSRQVLSCSGTTIGNELLSNSTLLINSSLINQSIPLEIDISSNQLTSLRSNEESSYFPLSLFRGDESFLSQLKITTLDLSDNRLDRLNQAWFNPNENILSNLVKLDVSRNKLKRIFENDGVFTLSKLKHLNLSHNLLGIDDGEVGSKQLFHYHHLLDTIDFSHNQISELHDYTFSDLKGVRSLNLSSNRIRDLDAISLARDRHINSSYLHYGPTQRARIANMPFFVELSHGLESLQHLDVSRNRIESPDLRVISQLHQLKTLDMRWNNWTCDADLLEFTLRYGQMKRFRLQLNVSYFPVSRLLFDLADFDLIGDTEPTEGYTCSRPTSQIFNHILNFTCDGANGCMQRFEELDKPPSAGYAVSIIVSVIALVTLFMMVVCYKYKLWQKMGFGNVKYTEVRRNLVINMDIHDYDDEDEEDILREDRNSDVIIRPGIVTHHATDGD